MTKEKATAALRIEQRAAAFASAAAHQALAAGVISAERRALAAARSAAATRRYKQALAYRQISAELGWG
jgi:hypothetical protein